VLGLERLLSIVEEVFEIFDRGCVIVPGIPHDARLRVKIGDAIRLVRPNKSAIDTHVVGLEMIHAPRPHPIPILLPLHIRKSDVPIGTKVLLLQTDA
jgi:hypothetical protein